MKKSILVVIILMFAAGIVMAQEKADMIDWGFNAAVGYGSYSYDLNEAPNKEIKDQITDLKNQLIELEN